MWKEVQPRLLQAIATSGKEPEVVEYGYSVYRLPLYHEGVYVERDLLLFVWKREFKGEVIRKCRPIRVVSSQYYLVPHSRLEKEMRDAGFEVSVLKAGTDFKAQGFLRNETGAVLQVRNSYRNGAFAVDILLKTEEVYLPVFKDALWMPHKATSSGKLLTKEALEEIWEFAKTIPSSLPKLKSERVPLGFYEFVRELKVVKREYENGLPVKEEVDHVGGKLYSKLKRFTNLYEFVLHLIKETEDFPEKGYAYRRVKERVERYTGVVIREVLNLREALERMKGRKVA